MSFISISYYLSFSSIIVFLSQLDLSIKRNILLPKLILDHDWKNTFKCVIYAFKNAQHRDLLVQWEGGDGSFKSYDQRFNFFYSGPGGSPQPVFHQQPVVASQQPVQPQPGFHQQPVVVWSPQQPVQPQPVFPQHPGGGSQQPVGTQLSNRLNGMVDNNNVVIDPTGVRSLRYPLWGGSYQPYATHLATYLDDIKRKAVSSSVLAKNRYLSPDDIKWLDSYMEAEGMNRNRGWNKTILVNKLYKLP